MNIELNRNSNYHVLTLPEIAAWQEGKSSSGGICAGIPALQRGLVWEPQQIEMLWDSIFRGFPIGSIVLAKKINNQVTQYGASHVEPSVLTHHILDGQQRCYAISLGFNNPWSNNLKNEVVLWLDLAPGARLKNSSRKYLFRVTTMAHPWGYRHDNQSSRLSADKIWLFMEKIKEKTKDQKRPLPEGSAPFDAGLPVPLALLFEHFKNGSLDLDALLVSLEKAMAHGSKWNELIDFFTIKIDEIRSSSSLQSVIEKGLQNATNTKLVALQVPEDDNLIDTFEQIFQRLNRQGTPLDNEELAYSMIKAYWPEIGSILSSNNIPKHTTEARLISMATRVALTDKNATKLHGEFSPDRIRNIFRSDASDADKKLRSHIEDYFQQKQKGDSSSEIARALKWIDNHFLYSERRTYGIPAYLRSSIAWTSRDVFVWLMFQAKQHEYQPIADENLIRRLLGLALTIHWFGINKARAVDHLIMQGDIKFDFQTDWKGENMSSLVLTPLNVDILSDEALLLNEQTSEICLEAWSNFWVGVVRYDSHGIQRPPGEEEARAIKFGQFVERLKSERELLVYVQRSYFENNFASFDPSNKLMWKGHNRPWDYDHILPSNSLDGTGRAAEIGSFHKVCKAWQNSIGNLVAVDFTFNRSYGAEEASKKYYLDAASLLHAKLADIQAYDLKLENTKDFDLSKKFVLAARNRLIELYRDWYNNLIEW
ncbi:DUF262 domain-containing protein [Nitrosomonas sp. Is37]|uniref:DUF262 domain-containing protein n=1 Tax=Nitrosomonas sp. Is37 TaxID=3080535 RepID=UPI00294ACD58|nr:DUF262 domain-containing protein [Nitrosomonas sp. Is37]MDV6345290.1 DUF262 domain-containing protein [Nitrosomonas sp. Is37]